MKRKLSIGLAVIILAALLYFLLFPAPLSEQQSLDTSPVETAKQPVLSDTVTADNTVVKETDDSEARRQRMEEAYQRLEQARKDLRRRLDRLKSRLWNLELPAAQARQVSEDMRRGYLMLKNPLLLGAFYDDQGIEREIKKIGAINKNLVEIETLVDQARSKSADN